MDAGELNPQVDEVVDNALDKRQFIDVTTPATPDTEWWIEHGFGTPALGFIVIKQDKAAITYAGTTAWDSEKIYLKTNVSTVALRVMVF